VIQPETPVREPSDDFERGYRQTARSAFLLARQLGRSTEEASDIVQEAAMRAWRYRATRTGDFKPWFLTIVYRQARRHRLLEWLPLPDGWDGPAPPPVSSSLDPDLLTALRRLPGRQRTALWLHYCDDLAVVDVARILGCTEAAAKQLLLRGRTELRKRLLEDTKR
jgi:RNA polymerase sigma-70 factor (ECF subfamily)